MNEDLLQDALQSDRDARDEGEMAVMPPESRPIVVFMTPRRGAKSLVELTSEELTDLYRNEKLTDEELARWSQGRGGLRHDRPVKFKSSTRRQMRGR